MPDVVVILVEPENADNVGMIARAMKNFGFRRLRIVRPMFDSFDRAMAAAMRAKDVLEGAEIFLYLDEAFEGIDVVIGTTARISKYNVDRRAIPLRTLVDSLKWDTVYGLVMGRESTGLTSEELAKCDVVVTIPTSSEYPALNLANATAIMLYEFYMKFNKVELWERPVSRRVREMTLNYIYKVVGDLDIPEHKKKGGMALIRRILERAYPCGVGEGEALYLLEIVKKVYERLKGGEDVPEASP